MMAPHVHVPNERFRAINSSRIERWLGGRENVERASGYMRGWYGPPINVRDIPGSVWIGRDGDFCGKFDRGLAASAFDNLSDHLRRLWRETGSRGPVFGAGFGSVGAALERASQGYRQNLNQGQIVKAGATGVVSAASTLWRVGSMPTGGSTSSAAPTGRAPDKSTTGAMAYTNPATGTNHLTGADMASSVVNNAILLYDRIFDVLKAASSSATESVTGVPTRYQSSTPGDADYAGGNFLFIEAYSALGGVAHNWTTCLYRDDAGNDSQTLPSLAGINGCIIDRLDMPLNSWFAPLAAGDVGIKDLAQLQCSSAAVTGSALFVIGHPIGIMFFNIVGVPLPFGWLTNRSLAPRIFDDACLALLEFPKPATTATTYSGMMYATNAAP